MPAPSLAELVAPAHTALVTQEVQGAVVGPGAALPELAEEARREAIPNIVRLLGAARAAGVPVVHCVAARRADARGSNSNGRLFAIARKWGDNMLPGSPGASVLPELGPEPSDVVLTRLHGLGPMGGTDLDAVLRNLGATTVVGVGVSVNLGMTNFAMDAANAGYHMVMPRDAVAGVPREYAEAVLDNSLSLIATLPTTDDVLAAWAP